MKNKDKERREQENKDLIERMKKGESLARCTTQDTWFQPRPIIKKDCKDIRRILGEDD